MVSDVDFINFLRGAKELSKEKRNEIVQKLNDEIYIKETRKKKIERIIRQNAIPSNEII